MVNREAVIQCRTANVFTDAFIRLIIISNVFSVQIKFENAINAVKERDFDAYVAVCKVP